MTTAWIAYLAAAILAELALPFAPTATALLDASVLFVALTHFGWAQRLPVAIGDPAIRVLPAVALIPLMRLLSLSLPIPDIPPIAWVALVGGTMLVAVAASARLAHLDVTQIAIGRVARDPASVAIVIGSVPAGILLGWLAPTPFEVPIGSPVGAGLMATALVGMAAIPEELIFRGVLQRLLGDLVGWLAPLVTAGAFAATYVGSEAPLAVLLMGVVGLAYGFNVRLSGSLWPAIIGHSLLVLTAVFIEPMLG
jgi:uncharacterized protein